MSRLAFRVLSCSGEDPDYPALDLQHHAAWHSHCGWQTPRYSSFPQEVVLQLEGASAVSRVQVLSHEFKIARRVELYAGMPPPGAPPGDLSMSTLEWKRLGYFSFDSNERSRFEARELKSVYLNTTAAALKLVVHAPLTNNLNVYNQIGVVAVNVHGRPLSPAGLVKSNDKFARHMQREGGGAQAGAGGGGLAVMDEEMGRVFRELAARKADAIGREDYDAAKSVKIIMERVRALGVRMGELEMRKTAAVNNDDFDLAKQLKYEIDQLRAVGLPQALTGGAMPHNAAAQPGRPSEMDVFNRALTKGDKERMALPTPAQPEYAGHITAEESEIMEPYGVEDAYIGMDIGAGMGGGMPANPEDCPLPQPKDDEAEAGPGTAHYPDPSEVSEEAMHGGIHTIMSPAMVARTHQTRRPKQSEAGGPKPEGADAEFFGELPAPEALEGAGWKDARPLVESMGVSEYVAACLYSKNWSLREAALQRVSTGIDSEEYVLEDGSAFAGLVAVLRKALADKVASVYYRSLPLLKAILTTGPAQGLRHRDVAPHASDLIAPLIERCANTNARIRDAALDALLFLARSKEVSLQAVAHAALAPVKNKKAAKDLIGRCLLLGELVHDFGVGRSGLQESAVMKVLVLALNSPAVEARSAGMRTALEVYRAGGDLKSHLQDVARILGEQMKAGMGAIDGGADVDAAVAAAEAANVSHRIPHKGGAAAAPKGGAAAAPKRPAVSRPSAFPGGGGGSTPGARSKASKPSPSPKPARSKGKQEQRAPPVEQLPPADELGEEDFEEPDIPGMVAELEARTAELGADHPDVAAVQLDLAVARNEEGDSEAAVELYESALATLEKVKGEDHIDVAQTLVDLAIIHLEHARNDVGRPMLERALVIRETVLGPDHEDVDAIRGVLEDPTFS
eukprot:PRCOL_00001559-RA